MSVGFILISVVFAAFALSYGWGVRGFIIGGEKGALLPGALMGVCVAFFAAGEKAGDLWIFFAAAGALSMFYGGTETYAQTMSYLLSRDKEGPYYNQLKKGVVGIFLKGGLWFAIPGFILAMLPSALSGLYKMWEIIVLFLLFPLVSLIGTKIFNSPYDRKNKKFPRIYFSLDRREEWGSNVMIILTLLVFLVIKGDAFAIGAGITGFITGGMGFLLGLILFDIERRHGDKLFGSLWKKGYIDGWKIMEHAFGAFSGGALMLYFALNYGHFSSLCSSVDFSLLTLGNDNMAGAAVCFILLLITTLQYPVCAFLEKKKGIAPDINIFELIERPLWSAVPLIFIFLGSYSAAAFAAAGTVFFALCEKCALEKFEHSRYKGYLRAPFKILWVVFPVWFFLNINTLSLTDTMLVYTLAYSLSCAMYTFKPDNIIALRKEKKSISEVLGSGITVTPHIIIQSLVILIFSFFAC